VHELLSLIVEEPPADADHKQGHKHPFVACEMLASESPVFLNRLVEDTAAMDYFFSLLSSEALNLTLAGYFSKVFGAILNRCSLKFLDYLFGEHKALQDMLRHVQCKSVADALLRVLTVDEDIYIPQRRLLIEALVDLVSTDNLAQLVHLTDLLIDLNTRSDELKIWTGVMSPLANQPTLVKITAVLGSEADLCVRATLTLLNALLSNPKFLVLVDPAVLQELMQAAVPAMETILDRPSKESLSTAFGEPIRCVGETKIRCLELISTLYRTGKLGQLVTASRLPELATALFMDFPWNSFLHQAFYQLVQTAMSGDLQQQVQFLAQTHLCAGISGLGLTDTLASGQTLRKCALGHAIRIGQLLLKASETAEIAQALEAEVGWGKYVSEVLPPLLKVESTAIGAERKSSDVSESELERLTTDVDVSFSSEVFLLFPYWDAGGGAGGGNP